MVLVFLTRGYARRVSVLAACLVFLLAGVVAAWGKNNTPTRVPAPPDLLLEGNRKLAFVRSFASERDTRGKQGFWGKLLDVVAGEPNYHQMVRPYGVAVDSRGRVIVTDPGAKGIHVFDFAEHKYHFLTRREKKISMQAPQCVAVDAQDNIYATDSEAGVIFVFDTHGSFRRVIGGLKGGEGYFKRPTGIAVDSAAKRIYITDTLRNKIFVLDMEGSVLGTIGKQGTGPGPIIFHGTPLDHEWFDRGRRHEFPPAILLPRRGFARSLWPHRGQYRRYLSAERNKC